MDNLNDLIALSADYDKEKTDYMVEIRDIRFNMDGSVTLRTGKDDVATLFGADGGERTIKGMSPHALKQLCNARLDIPSAYMAKCPPELRAMNLEHWRQKTVAAVDPENKTDNWIADLLGRGGSRLSQEMIGRLPYGSIDSDPRPRSSSKWFIRANGETARAILSERYAPIPNTDVLKATQEIIGALDHELIRPVVTPDNIYVKIKIADVDPRTLPFVDEDEKNNYGVGIMVSNDEIGKGSLRAIPMIQRTSCKNSFVLRRNEFALEMRHQYYSPGLMRGRLQDAIGRALKVGMDTMNDIHEAMKTNIPNIADVLDQIGAKYRLSSEVVDAAKIGTEGQRTRMGVVNGLSFAAHSARQITDDTREMLEGIAGEALTQDFFKSVGDRVIVR